MSACHWWRPTTVADTPGSDAAPSAGDPTGHCQGNRRTTWHSWMTRYVCNQPHLDMLSSGCYRYRMCNTGKIERIKSFYLTNWLDVTTVCLRQTYCHTYTIATSDISPQNVFTIKTEVTVPFQSSVEVFEVEQLRLLLRLDSFHQKVDNLIKLFRWHVTRRPQMITQRWELHNDARFLRTIWSCHRRKIQSTSATNTGALVCY